MSKWKKQILKISILIGIVIMARYTYNLCFVQGESMVPTLENNQIKFALRTTLVEPKRWDIVTVKVESNYYLIKRVIGLPGETIEYKNGKLYINGKETEDKFSHLTEDYKITLSENEYCCLGDNRQHSSDSREYGAFPKKEITSVLVFEREK